MPTATQSRLITNNTTPTNTPDYRVEIGDYKGGSWTTDTAIGNVTWYGAFDETMTPLPLYTEDNDIFTKAVTANTIIPLPINESYGCKYLFAKGSAAGGTLKFRVK